MALFKRPNAQPPTPAPPAASMVTDLQDLVRWLAANSVVADGWWSPAVCYRDAEGTWHANWECPGLRGETLHTRRGLRLGDVLASALCRCGWERIAASTPQVISALALRDVVAGVWGRPIPADPDAIVAEVAAIDRIRRGTDWPQAPLPELTPALVAVENVCVQRAGELRAALVATSGQLVAVCAEALHDPRAPFPVDTLVSQYADGAILSTTEGWLDDPLCARVALTFQVPPSGSYTLGPCLLAAPAPVAAWASSKMLTTGWQAVKADPGEDLSELAAKANRHWSKNPDDDMHRLFRAVNRARGGDTEVGADADRGWQAYAVPQAATQPGLDSYSAESSGRPAAPAAETPPASRTSGDPADEGATWAYPAPPPASPTSGGSVPAPPDGFSAAAPPSSPPPFPPPPPPGFQLIDPPAQK